jgi:hypothetical protein
MSFNTQKLPSKKAAIIEMHEMLSYCRPAGTKAEQAFVNKFVDTIPGVWGDGYGNRHLVIGNTNVLWSSHTDSVHSYGGRQIVLKGDGLFMLKEKQPGKPACLGADCATGVWIMRQMILRGIPGHYIFHRDEECGGLGSSWLAKNDPGLLDGVQFAIAFDRKGYDSVITHQGHRTASDAFAKSMAAQLGGKYKPDDTGLFTDTAKYSEIIPECTNLSVGYHSAHTEKEWQDFDFAYDLLERITEVDTSKLVAERDPKVVEYWGGAGRYRWTDHYDDWDHANWIKGGVNATRSNYPIIFDQGDFAAERSLTSGSTNYQKLLNLLLDYPTEIADILDTEGMDAETLADMLAANLGR